ncbi:MAG: NnrS family protein [Pseudobdellovibrio sp.]
MSNVAKSIEPYQILFPIGILLACVGVIPWILFSAGAVAVYPNLIHAKIMVLGFLISFVSGFLMTAVPKMSGSKSASNFEISICMLLIFAQILFALFNLLTLSSLVGCLQFLFLFSHLALRIKERTQDPPSVFIFIPVGMLAGLLGCLSLIFQDELSPAFLLLGKLLLYQAFVLNLIVGLGSRLIPVLSRVAGALSPIQQGKKTLSRSIIILVLLNSSFLLEAFIDKSLGVAIRFLVLAYVLVADFKIFHKPTEITWLGICLRVAAIFMALPYLVILFFPNFELHLLHMFFISGISLMTLMVAVRVILSHGGHSLSLEKESIRLPLITFVLITATLVRSLGPIFFPQFFLAFILIAASLWIFGIGFWAKTFWPKITVWRSF